MNRQELAGNVALNLEKQRVEMGLTQSQMAEKLEMSLSGYKKLVNGETSKIDVYVIYLMHKLTGKWGFEMIAENVEYGRIVQKLRQLTPQQRSFVEGVIDFEAGFQPSSGLDEDYISVFVLTGDFEDGMIYDSSNIIKVNAAPYRKKFGSDLSCGIKVTSNHLLPAYVQGDILLICRRPMRHGDTGVFINRETGRAYVRKFYQTSPCRLEPINGMGEVFFVNSDDPEDVAKWIKFGYVLTKMRVNQG